MLKKKTVKPTPNNSRVIPDERSDSERELVRKAMSIMGKSRSEKKLAALAINRAKPKNRPFHPLAEYPCTCGKKYFTETHLTTCPRGLAIRRRQAKGVPLSD